MQPLREVEAKAKSEAVREMFPKWDAALMGVRDQGEGCSPQRNVPKWGMQPFMGSTDQGEGKEMFPNGMHPLWEVETKREGYIRQRMFSNGMHPLWKVETKGKGYICQKNVPKLSHSVFASADASW
jgi:hypothetical protein